MINSNHKVGLGARIEFVIGLLDSDDTACWQMGEDGRVAMVVQRHLVHILVLVFHDRDSRDPSEGLADGLDDDGLALVVGPDAQGIEWDLSCACV